MLVTDAARQHALPWPWDSRQFEARLDAPETESQNRALQAGHRIDTECRNAVDFRHSGWARTRRRIAESLARTEQSPNRQASFADCGSHAYVLRNVDEPERFRIAGSACHDRFCLPCARERGSIIAGNVTELVGQREVRFITLTVKATQGDELAERINHLYKSFGKLRRVRLWQRSVTAGVAFCEVKWSRSETWHPHIHAIVTGRWIDKRKLQRAWKRATGDSFVVDIRRPSGKKNVIDYVTNYAAKPFNDTFTKKPKQLDEAIVALHGRHLCLTFGAWRGEQLTETGDDGAWEHVCSLETLFSRVASGDDSARAILDALTDANCDKLLARAPPLEESNVRVPKATEQLTWFGTWSRDGTYRYPLG